MGGYDNGSSGVGAKLYGNTNAALVVDGYTGLGFDDRVLVKDQTNKHIMVSTQSTALVVVQLTLNLSEQQRMIAMQRLRR